MTDPNPPAGGNPPPPPPPPPRPGQTVPQGGLDPTQVFGSPPPPPSQQGDQGQGGTAQGQQPKDVGPPPPPPGPLSSDEDLKAKGYDDEDIRVLKEIGNYRFSSITTTCNNDNINVPTHPETQFDVQEFLSLLRGSISLTRDEKWRIIQAIPKLSQFQIDELQKILQEEKKKFSNLSPKHLLQLMKLEQKHAEDWKDLQSITLQEGVKEQDQQQAEDIRKQLGL